MPQPSSLVGIKVLMHEGCVIIDEKPDGDWSTSLEKYESSWRVWVGNIIIAGIFFIPCASHDHANPEPHGKFDDEAQAFDLRVFLLLAHGKVGEHNQSQTDRA